MPAPPTHLIDVASKRLQPLTLRARERMNTAGAQLATTAHAAHQAVSAITPTPGRHLKASATGPRPPAPHERRRTHRPAPGPGITP